MSYLEPLFVYMRRAHVFKLVHMDVDTVIQGHWLRFPGAQTDVRHHSQVGMNETSSFSWLVWPSARVGSIWQLLTRHCQNQWLFQTHLISFTLHPAHSVTVKVPRRELWRPSQANISIHLSDGLLSLAFYGPLRSSYFTITPYGFVYSICAGAVWTSIRGAQ